MNKKLIAIILVLVVLLLGGASIYVATQLSTQEAVAPTAPESEPLAAEPIYGGSEACTVTASASASVCTPSGVVTCTPDCPTECGKVASIITTCKDSCGTSVSKNCPATSLCQQVVIEGSKTAFKNETTNTAGNYTLTTEIDTVAKSQIYVYSIDLTNTSDVDATGVTIKDSLKNVTSVTYMDTVAGCTWNATDVELTCNTTIKKDETKTFSFRVKAADGVANGDIITNIAKVTYTNGTAFDLKKDLTVSTVVGCNNTCTTDAECSTGLVCDTTAKKCRRTACLAEDDCTCAVVVTTVPVVTIASTATATPTAITVAEATPTILPETGIFDLPGIAAFGGGLLLAVVGILLAL